MSDHTNRGIYWLHIGSMPASSICGYKLPPRMKQALLEANASISMLDLHRFYAEGHSSIGIQSIAKTEFEKRSLLEAVSRFINDAALNENRYGRAESDKLAWIVPDSRLTGKMRLTHLAKRTMTEFKLPEELGDDYENWLPWLSLAMVTVLKRWRQPTISSLHRAFIKLFADSEYSYPWEASNLTWRHYLPIKVLYRYEPSINFSRGLSTFTELGLTSINDLRFCHPNAVAASKAKHQPLFELYRALSKEEY